VSAVQAGQPGVAGWRVEGNPTNAELAAVVAAVTAAASAAASSGYVGPSLEQHDVTSGWSAYWRTMRSPLPSGPGAWWASAQPRG
jgi:hypothetical protein